MESTVSTKNMISLPASIARRYGIKPGWKLQWIPGDEPDRMTVKVIPDRAELARRLLGQGKEFARGRDVLAELVAERGEEDRR